MRSKEWKYIGTIPQALTSFTFNDIWIAINGWDKYQIRKDTMPSTNVLFILYFMLTVPFSLGIEKELWNGKEIWNLFLYSQFQMVIIGAQSPS